jgi:glycosyltransferase involved in cell wall biosynthesis
VEAERRREGPGGMADVLIFGIDHKNEIRARQLTRGLSVNFRFFKMDKLLIPAYGLSDIFVMDSVLEGFPLVLLKSMSSGCAPFVTRFPGVTDAVRHGINGWIGKTAGDTLAKALSVDSAQLKKMSAEASQTAWKFSWKKTAEQYENIYRGL